MLTRFMVQVFLAKSASCVLVLANVASANKPEWLDNQNFTPAAPDGPVREICRCTPAPSNAFLLGVNCAPVVIVISCACIIHAKKRAVVTRHLICAPSGP